MLSNLSEPFCAADLPHSPTPPGHVQPTHVFLATSMSAQPALRFSGTSHIAKTQRKKKNSWQHNPSRDKISADCNTTHRHGFRLKDLLIERAGWTVKINQCFPVEKKKKILFCACLPVCLVCSVYTWKWFRGTFPLVPQASNYQFLSIPVFPVLVEHDHKG